MAASFPRTRKASARLCQSPDSYAHGIRISVSLSEAENDGKTFLNMALGEILWPTLTSYSFAASVNLALDNQQSGKSSLCLKYYINFPI